MQHNGQTYELCPGFNTGNCQGAAAGEKCASGKWHFCMKCQKPHAAKDCWGNAGKSSGGEDASSRKQKRKGGKGKGKGKSK